MEESLDSLMVLEWARRVDVDDEDETGLQKKNCTLWRILPQGQDEVSNGGIAASRKNGRKKKGNECR